MLVVYKQDYIRLVIFLCADILIMNLEHKKFNRLSLL